MALRIFGLSFIVSAIALVTSYFYGGWNALFLCVALGLLEVSLSFDNAIVNAKILNRMSEFFQKLFLTVGVLIAVFGMRIVFPIAVVSIAANMGPIEAVKLALEKGDPHTPGTYGYILSEAHPQIAAFGGIFLLMLFLGFIFEEKDIHWLRWIEKPLEKIGRVNYAAPFVALAALVGVAIAFPEDKGTVLEAGILGLLTYLAVDGLGSLFEGAGEDEDDKTPGIHGDAAEAGDRVARRGPSGVAKATGKAGVILFLYLEVIDASFSFDGVIGAFAITSDPIIIALGLGLIGAMFVRSFTIYLVRTGTLSKFPHLDHGAHWAIGALAAILLISIGVHVSEIITGLVGVVLIIAALITSVRYNKKHPEDAMISA